MPTYLFRGSLTAQGVAGILAEGGTARRRVATEAIEALGGTVEAYYFAFGEHDAVMIAHLPDDAAASAFAMTAAASGAIAMTTTVLITPEDVDRARSLKSGWRAPGG